MAFAMAIREAALIKMGVVCEDELAKVFIGYECIVRLRWIAL